MIRHLNRTDRARIAPRHVKVDVFRPEELRPPIFMVTELKLESYEFPGDATIRIEAYKGNALQRWQWGTVAEPQAPPESDRYLTDAPARSNFRISVVDGDGSGRLLGRADRIVPLRGRESLIEVVPKDDMEQEVWRVGFDPEPELHVNSDIPQIIELVRSDATFRSLVLPDVLRTVLHRAVIVEGEHADTNEEGTWTNWFRLAKRHYDGDPPSVSSQATETELKEAWDWIDAVTTAFAAQPALRAVQRFTSAQRRGS